MTAVDAPGPAVDRFEVRSRDGTPLAVWVEGRGPALVMVHGSIADHTTFDPFVEVLRDDLTSYCMDRRGFGASGDSSPYTIERDFEDVAAVVDAVAELVKATEAAVAAVPHAGVHFLDGHGHFAHKTDPAMVSAVIRAFFAP